MSTNESIKSDAERDKLAELYEGVEQCNICGEWSIDVRDGLCKNEDCERM